MKKKQSKDWYIATTYMVTASFGVPFLILLPVLIGAAHSVVHAIIMLIATFLSIWLGTVHAAEYINKAYIIKDSNKIAKLATIYFGIWNGGITLLGLIALSLTLPASVFIISMIIFVVLLSIEIYFYYTLSKKYIKNTETLTPQQ